eukprot:PLAT6926.1.p2 GENE.PLAT6926.1~~PLAT6926.1.p2  ORF type:complete len:652 (+),score=365.57 PLAT6926.1:54-1958(+)
MGNIAAIQSARSLFSEAKRKECSDIASDTLSAFAPAYTMGYATALINKIKEEKTADEGPDWWLRDPPTPSDPLHSGFMFKAGAVNKAFKKRFFVALNQADNYAVYYYKTEADSAETKKACGAMNLDGYEVKSVDFLEEGKEGAEISMGTAEEAVFGLVLDPNCRRRTWYLRCEDKESRDKWQEVFKTCARGAEPPMNPDPVLAQAFIVAYQKTRWKLGVYWWWRPAGTESEMLGNLVTDKCMQEVMEPLWPSLPSGRTGWQVRQVILKTLDGIIGTAVSASWKTASSLVEKAAPEVESKVRDSIGPILELQESLRGKLEDAALGIITPALEKLSEPVLGPLFNVLLVPLMDAYAELMRSFNDETKTLVDKLAADPSAHEAEFRTLMRHTRYYYGPMRGCLDKLWALAGYGTSEVGPLEVLGDVLQGVSAWTIVYDLEDRARTMYQRAVYTLDAALKQAADSSEEPLTSEQLFGVRKTVFKMLAHDIKLQALIAFNETLQTVMLIPVTSDIIPMLQDVLSPINDAIPDPMKTLVDLDDIVETMLENITCAAVEGVTEEPAGEKLGAVDELAMELLGVDSLEISEEEKIDLPKTEKMERRPTKAFDKDEAEEIAEMAEKEEAEAKEEAKEEAKDEE